MTGADVKTAYIRAAAATGGLIIMVLGYAAVGMMLKRLNITAPFEPPAAYVAKYAVYLISASAFAAFKILKKKFPKQATPEETLKNMVRHSIMRSAISEMPAILGLMLFMLTGFYTDLVLLLAFSLALEIFYFPRLSAWKDTLRVEFNVQMEGCHPRNP